MESTKHRSRGILRVALDIERMTIHQDYAAYLAGLFTAGLAFTSGPSLSRLSEDHEKPQLQPSENYD